jgi:hypothetical protein
VKWQKEKNKQEEKLVELVHSVFDPFGKYAKRASEFDEDRMKKV